MDVTDFDLCKVEGLPDEIKKALGCPTSKTISEYFKTLVEPKKKCFGKNKCPITEIKQINFPNSKSIATKPGQVQTSASAQSISDNKLKHIQNLLSNTNLYNYVLRFKPDEKCLQAQQVQTSNENKLELVIGKYDYEKHKQFYANGSTVQFETHQGIKHGQLLTYGIDIEKKQTVPKLLFSGTLIQVKENDQYTILINPMSGCWENNKSIFPKSFSSSDLDLFNVTCISHVLKNKYPNTTESQSKLILRPCGIAKSEAEDLKCLLGIPEIFENEYVPSSNQ